MVAFITFFVQTSSNKYVNGLQFNIRLIIVRVCKSSLVFFVEIETLGKLGYRVNHENKHISVKHAVCIYTMVK